MNKTLHQMYMLELHLLLNRERQLIDAIPHLAQEATHDDLETALHEHLTETNEHADRLEKILESHGEQVADGKTCGTMKTLLSEGEDMVEAASADQTVKDSVIIAGARTVEHFEKARYQVAIEWADVMGHDEDKTVLEKTLKEEDAAADKLSSIAQGGWFTGGVNDEAGE